MAVLESTLGAVARVGPYFVTVSLIPAAVFVYTVWVLGSAQPWTGNPNWRAAWASASGVTLSGFLAGAVATAVVALVLHPLQFALVQFLEGYWGTSGVAVRIGAARIRWHMARAEDLDLVQSETVGELARRQGSNTVLQPDQVEVFWRGAEAARARLSYPLQPDQLLPTRLGNIMRKYESGAGAPYGLNAVAVSPHLALVAAPSRANYLGDQRTQLDVVCKLAVVAAALFVVTTVLFAACGWWLLLALAPYVLAHLLYRGACVAAHNWGAAFQTMVDLDRHALYTAVGVPSQPTLAEERARNVGLDGILRQRLGDVNLQLETSRTAAPVDEPTGDSPAPEESPGPASES
jgi:hypothetical protein